MKLLLPRRLKRIVEAKPHGLRCRRRSAPPRWVRCSAPRSELLAIRVADLRFKEEGLEIFIPKSRQDPEGHGRWAGIPEERGSPTCPVSNTKSTRQQLRPASRSTPSYTCRFAIFINVDEAVAAATVAFEQLSERMIAERSHIIDHIRRIDLNERVESARWRWKKPLSARPQDRAMLGDARQAWNSCAASVQRRQRPGRHRIRSVRRNRAHHPATHSLPTITGNAGEHDCRRKHAGRQSASERQARRRRRRSPVQRSHRSRLGIDNLICLIAAAETNRIGRRDLQPSRCEADLRHWWSGGCPGRDEEFQAGDCCREQHQPYQVVCT